MKEYSLKYLVIRAAAVLLIVAAVLVGLRLRGLTGRDQDIPPEVVEEMARNRGAAPAEERP